MGGGTATPRLRRRRVSSCLFCTTSSFSPSWWSSLAWGISCAMSARHFTTMWRASAVTNMVVLPEYVSCDGGGVCLHQHRDTAEDLDAVGALADNAYVIVLGGVYYRYPFGA